MSYLTLHMIDPNTNGTKESITKLNNKVNISKEIVPAAPNNVVLFGAPDLYIIFRNFMLNPTYIRYGICERIVTSKLVVTFNQVTQQNITFNSTFPKLMARFMQEHPHLNISKKLRTEGTTYIGVGLVDGPIFNNKQLPITPYKRDKEREQRAKDKYNQKVLVNRRIAGELKDAICQKTQWSIVQYDQLINLHMIPVFMNKNRYNLDAMIEATRANIIYFTYHKIEKLDRFTAHATVTKEAFIMAMKHDNDLSVINNFPTYTERLKVAEVTYATGDTLLKKIRRYNNIMQNLPQIDHIVYPNIQHLTDLANWLKENSMHRTRKDMDDTQYKFEDDEVPQAVDWTLEDTLLNHAESNRHIMMNLLQY